MMITVASGKGGTGKTTVATNLAVAVGEGATLLDCDVEEPNVHLFLNPESVITTPVTTMVPVVDEDVCVQCGACSELCQFSAITLVAGELYTFPRMCHSCGGCVMVCPSGALSEGTRELGELERGRYKGIELITGRLKVGEAMSPPLIDRVKEAAEGKELVIVDAPPGTSCPVIAAMGGTHYVVLVTEPTPFGLNDLKLAVEAVRVLGIPFGIVINRADAGDDRVVRYAEEEGIEILMSIPYSRKVAEYYARGRLLVEAMPEMAEAFEGMVNKIRKATEGGTR
ncbi:ATP-binding protein [Desulfoluna butyratoxydans]|uniref:4fe-4s dicluster domain n=1 Tax=Desulfoluna butyratoxydans TaxID=231438 RepID=A0A4U8YMA1_9BACT|nr:ATP-binding protein [Desulfoluna butyratoxydans]VFQ44299.1 4fe-4s dicluster domain [Desulfoluna butyratoxydans]